MRTGSTPGPADYPGPVHHPETAPTRRGIALRWIGFILAIGLGALAVWLVTMGDSTRRTQLGVLAGLWAALLAAFAMFGSRRHLHPSESQDQAGPRPGSALELRMAATELERAEEAAARRAHEARLEHLLRREIQATVAHELSALRDEITQLRSEIVEKVDGRLRLERIETTRVIGSDLEALQHEIRQLKQVAGQDELLARPREPLRQIVEPARVRPVTRQTAEVEATVQPARQSDVVQEPAASGSAPMPPDATAPIRLTPIPPPASAPAAAANEPSTPAQPVRPPISEAPAQPARPAASEPPTPQSPPATPVTPAAASATQESPQPPAPTPQPAAPAPDVQTARQPNAGIPRADAPPVPSLRGVPLGEIPLPPTVVPVIVTVDPPRPPETPRAPESARPPEPPKPAEPSRAPDPNGDFAGLPRIRPFTDFELDPIIEPPRETAPQRTRRDRAADDDEPDYTGRRRRGEEAEALGRHAHRPEPTGRRHRQPDDDEPDDHENGHDTGQDAGHDLLARLLSRESR